MSWFRSNKDKPKLGDLGRLDHVHHPIINDHNGVKHPILDYTESHELGRLDHVHRPVFIDYNGVQHPKHGYAGSRNSEQYMAKTEEVKYRLFSGMEDQKYGPVRKEVYGTGDWSGKDDNFPPKVHYERVRGPMNDSPWNNSPPSKDHHHPTHGKYGNLNLDSSYTNDEDVHVNNSKARRPNNIKEQEYYNGEKNKRNGFTEEGSRQNHLKDQEDYYENESPKKHAYTVPISTHSGKENGHDNAIGGRMGPIGSQPRNQTSNFNPRATSPPQPKKEQESYNQDTIDSDEARRRYGKASPAAGPGLYAQDKPSGPIIDSKKSSNEIQRCPSVKLMSNLFRSLGLYSY